MATFEEALIGVLQTDARLTAAGMPAIVAIANIEGFQDEIAKIAKGV